MLVLSNSNNHSFHSLVRKVRKGFVVRIALAKQLINALIVETQGFHFLKEILLNCCQLSSALEARDGLTGDIVPILGVIIRVPIPGFTLAPKSSAATLIVVAVDRDPSFNPIETAYHSLHGVQKVIDAVVRVGCPATGS